MKLLDYSIEGAVKSTSRMDFSQVDLEIHGFVGEEDVAHCPVDKSGHYKMTFQFGEQMPVMELRVLPAELSHEVKYALTLNTKISPKRYLAKNGSRMARQDVLIPSDFVEIAQKATKLYKMHGAVYATEFLSGYPIAIEPMPGAKMEFFLVNPPPLKPVFPFPSRPVPVSLGHAYTGPDGEYQFQFKFAAKNQPKLLPGLPGPAEKPDIRAKIYQFAEGAWKLIYTAPVDWDIVDDFHRDYFVPEEDVIPIPPEDLKPEEGFRFSSVGLLPIDETRLVKGYFTAHAGDPLPVSHSPFCDTLNVFGLFAEAPPVAYYRMEIAEADEDGATGAWTDLMDPLTNYKWNNTTHAWDSWNMGPDAVTHLYTNIDPEPESDWLFHSLKLAWNTRSGPDGYYALRITGYDATMTPTGTYAMPVMRVDNTPPEVALDVISPAVGKCGGLALGVDRLITFNVTAFDPAGHVARYWLSGTRGKTALTAGATVEVDRPSATSTWAGSYEDAKTFDVLVRPPELADCAQIAYNFELHARGLATNGYAVEPQSQWARVEVNLIVSEE